VALAVFWLSINYIEPHLTLAKTCVRSACIFTLASYKQAIQNTTLQASCKTETVGDLQNEIQDRIQLAPKSCFNKRH